MLLQRALAEPQKALSGLVLAVQLRPQVNILLLQVEDPSEQGGAIVALIHAALPLPSGENVEGSCVVVEHVASPKLGDLAEAVHAQPRAGFSAK